jgi:hypothetical protein
MNGSGINPMSRPLLTLLLLSLLLLTACASPSPAAPTLAISGPVVDVHTGQPVTADVYM